MTAEEKALKIYEFLDNKKAIDIKVLKVADLTSLSEYFVIANGTSNTHIKALADEVDFQMENIGMKGRLEGKASDWLLLDFGDVITHIFIADSREHYNLEKLWADAQEISVEELA